MSHNLSIRRSATAALAGAALLTAMSDAAGAAVPKEGYYSGPTSQQITPADPAEQPEPGSVDFKVFKYGSSHGTVRKLLKVGATTQLECASGEVKEDRFLAYIILGGKINKRGKFTYSYKGFTIKGRFTTRTSAKGTLTRIVGDCKAEGITWNATRSTAGIPIS
jgi:hypothetical protein